MGWWENLKKRAKEEWNQLKDQGTMGYIAQNATTVVAKAVEMIGLEETAQKLRNNRAEYVAEAQTAEAAMKNKTKEELHQLKDQGTMGYIAQNATTVIAEAAEMIGLDETAQKLRNNRPEYVAEAQTAEAAMKTKAKQEWHQLKDQGAMGYVAQNATTVIAEAAEMVGMDETTQKLRNNRPEYVAEAQTAEHSFTERTAQEFDQFLDLGPTEYIKQNASTLANTTKENLKDALRSQKSEPTRTPATEVNKSKLALRVDKHYSENTQTQEQKTPQREQTKLAKTTITKPQNERS